MFLAHDFFSNWCVRVCVCFVIENILSCFILCVFFRYSSEFIKLNRRMLVSNDRFIRTTEKQHHKVCQDLWRRCAANGDIYLDTYKGLFVITHTHIYRRDSTFKILNLKKKYYGHLASLILIFKMFSFSYMKRLVLGERGNVRERERCRRVGLQGSIIWVNMQC
jgi:hypothetical protein